MNADKLKSGLLAIALATLCCNEVVAQERTITITNYTDEMELTKRVSAPMLTHRSNETTVVSWGATARPSTPVELLAHRCDFRTKTNARGSNTVQLVEFEIRERDSGGFRWHCWEAANSYPHDFRLFMAENRYSYACYVSSEGVKLFRIIESNDSDMARQLFREKRAAVGEIEYLRVGLLHETVGREAFRGKNALYDPITVDRVSEVASELRVTLHGNKPDQMFTFAWKAGQWSLAER